MYTIQATDGARTQEKRLNCTECVEFEKVETGEKFHFDNIINGISKIA